MIKAAISCVHILSLYESTLARRVAISDVNPLSRLDNFIVPILQITDAKRGGDKEVTRIERSFTISLLSANVNGRKE
jgi:hypothetical protein